MPCFEALIDHLSAICVEDDELLMLHQLFQAIMLARLEATKQGAPDPALRIPPHTYNIIRKCAPPSGAPTLSHHPCDAIRKSVLRFLLCYL